MSKPKIGDVLAIAILNRGRVAEVRPATVTKVGIKYLSVVYLFPSGGEEQLSLEIEFHIDTFIERTHLSASYRLFPNEQTYLDEQEEERWRQAFRKHFDHWSRKPISLDQYRAGAELFGITMEKEG